MSILALSINEISINQDSEGRFCLNDLHKAAGNNQKHRPKYFLETQQAQDLISEIENYEGGIPPSKKAVEIIQGKGKAQGTYVVKELVYAYAMWISAKFHLKVIRAYDALVTKAETELPPSPERKTKKALPGCLTLEMQDVIKEKVKANVLHLPQDKQAGQIIKQWSALKKKFGCTYKEIPATEYLNAISLLERLPIEGELLGKDSAPLAIPNSTEYDYNRGRESLENIRKAAVASVDDAMLSALFDELNALEQCLISAFTHMDESIFRLQTVLLFQKRWRGCK